MENKNSNNSSSSFFKKHKLIIIIAGALLLVGVAVALIFGLSGGGNTPSDITGDRPDPNPVTNGVEQRVYYYDLPEQEAELTLYDNWTFVLTGPRLHKSGEYSIDTDGSLILDFVRNLDGAGSAVAEGTTVVLNYDGATNTFYERLEFSVTFDTDGGSKVDTLSVTNGKTLAAPADPTKDGYTFDGWYTDEALTKPFSFGITLITEDITLYAKWS